MHIVHLLDSFEYGGAQRVALDLINWQLDKGHQVTVLGRSGQLEGSFPAASRVVIPEPASTVDYAFAAQGIVRHDRPSIIHSHQRKEALIGWALGKARGAVTVEHAHTVLQTHRFRHLSFRSRHVFAVSPEVGAMVTQTFKVPQHRVSVVGNAPSVELAASSAHRIDPRRQVRLLAVGRLTAQKDPERYVRIAKRLSTNIDVDAIWIGGGEGEAAVEMLNAALGNPVRFVGQRDDVGSWLEDSDVVLMTSRWEGLPLVALEALASGTTLVAPDLDGLSSLVNSPIGPLGYLYKPDATDAEVAELISSLIGSDEAAIRAKRGRDYVMEHHSKTSVFEAIDAVYERLTS